MVWAWRHRAAIRAKVYPEAALAGAPPGFEATHFKTGELKGEINSSTSAEARAVANGLHHFIKEGLIPPASCVRITCDNQAVVKKLHFGKVSSKSHQVDGGFFGAVGFKKCDERDDPAVPSH